MPKGTMGIAGSRFFSEMIEFQIGNFCVLLCTLLFD